MNKDIQKQGKYFFIGDEQFKIKEILKKLMIKLDISKNDINYSYFEGKDTKYIDIVNSVITLPFLADKKLVILENTSLASRYIDFMPKFFNEIPESTVLVIIEASIDSRTKAYKVLKENCEIIECKIGSFDEKRKILDYVLKINKKEMDEKSKSYVLNNSEDELYSVYNNAQKICSATLDSIIDYELVLKNLLPITRNRIFDMLKFIIIGNSKMVISIYKDLLQLKEDEFKMLLLLNRELRLFIKIKEMKGSDKEVGIKLGIADFAVKNIRKIEGNVSRDFLINSLDKVVQLEADIKMGYVDKKMGFEKLMFTLLFENINKKTHS